ncbi:MAG: DUF934 domain-containing protein [Ahrensia sp.]
MQHNETKKAEALIIVDDKGFAEDDLTDAFVNGHYGEITLADLAIGLPANRPRTLGLILAVDSNIDAVLPYLQHLDVIKIPFASFSDGRGFSLAVELRRAGFAGRLRATGHVIVDQYAHARRCGFDEVAISTQQADRQPEHQWRAEVPKINETYQIRLHQAGRAA